MDKDDEIAIVGIGCRFPGADDIDEYWKVLSKGENHVKEIPKDRWNVDDVYDEDPSAPGKTNVRQAGFVKNYNEWDHRFFGINEMEAELIDPQQRMVLDCVHMALEDGGIRRQDIDGTYTGVYIGSMNDDYKVQAMTGSNNFSAYSVTGLHNSIISARVAYVYNLFGPAVTMDTACSSSMVAINIAEHALRLGTCDTAICGGVNSILDPLQFVALSKARMLSPTGQSKPFSAAADGYARGEGCGIVILKRLKEAVRDGNKIWGVLKTGSNQDGHTATPITAPSGSQQLDLLNRLYSRHKVDKNTVQVIEAHGTGTPVGDPIETNALGQFFCKPKGSDQMALIGSVKSNVGHTEAAAGTAGLIKVLLMMKHGEVVPSLLLDKENINPKINFEKYGFEVPTEVTPWPQPNEGGRVACVNSFGFGGTNAHAIVHEHLQMPVNKNVKEQTTSEFPPIIAISALDEASLRDNIKTFSQQLKNKTYDMKSLSYTSLCKRDHRVFRKAFFSESQEHLIEVCDSYENSATVHMRKDETKVVFVFCGVGTTWKGMCSFMMGVDVFKNAIQSIDELLLPLAGWTLSSKLSSNGEILADPLVGHVAIFGCQVGLVEVWKHFGICPDIVVGQSVGEVAAAYTSGALDLESAVRVIYYRSKFLAEVKGGAMAVVKNVDTQKIENLCATTNGKLSIAVYNSSTSCTITGDKAAIDMVRSKLTNGLGADGGILIDLDVTCAYHSSYVEGAAKKATEKLKKLKVGTISVPIVSTVSGKQENHELFVHEDYWERNTRCAVRFSDGVQCVAALSEQTIFIEIGPGPVLGAHIKNLFGNDKSKIVLPSMRKGNEKNQMCQTLCTLYELGINPKWNQIVQHTGTLTDLPKYAFRKQIVPYKSGQMQNNLIGQSKESSQHMYVQRDFSTENAEFVIQISEATTPFIFDHIVNGSILVPGALYADLGFEIGRALLGAPTNEAVVSLEFTKTAKVERTTEQSLTVDTYSPTDSEVRFYVKQEQSIVCIGKVTKNLEQVDSLLEHENEAEKSEYDIQQIRLHIMKNQRKSFDAEEMYKSLHALGFQYGPCFRIMEECITNEGECLAAFQIPPDVFRDLGKTVIHPCLLDGLLQSTMLATEYIDLCRNENLIMMPVAIEAIKLRGKAKKPMVYSYSKNTNVTILTNVLKMHYNTVLLNQDGTVILEIKNYTTYSRRDVSFTPDELKYQLGWLPTEIKLVDSNQPKTLLIDITDDPLVTSDFANDRTSICRLPTGSLSDELLHFFIERSAKRQWGSFEEVEAIVVLFGKDENLTCISPESTNTIYNSAKSNCLILVWLFRFLMERKKIPVFITTQNTQTVAGCEEFTEPNLRGCEVWGFMRNVLLEFVHDKITLVDLKPSYRETKSTFLNFMASTVANIDSSQTEYVICNDQLFGARFVKTEMTEVMPTDIMSQCRHLNDYGIVKSETSSKISGPYISISTDTNVRKKHTNGFVAMKVETVSLHQDILFPTTNTAAVGLGVPWQNIQEEGHTVIGVEYTGYLIEPKSSKKIYRCNDNSIIPEEHYTPDIWQFAAVFPQQMKTEVSVPRDCMVNLKELPFYQPNLLSQTIMWWHMKGYLSSKSKVKIISDSKVTPYSWLLEKMLKVTGSITVESPFSSAYVDDIILTGKCNDDMLDSLRNCKSIICLRHALPSAFQKHLAGSHDVTVTEIDTRAIFRQKEVAKTLKKVVPWLKRNVYPEEFRELECLSQRSIGIAKNGVIDLPFKISQGKMFSKKDIFIITGGLTGLGWHTILMLVENSVGVIATMSRRTVEKEIQKQIEETEAKYDCQIRCFQGDVSNLHSVQSMVSDLERQYGSGRIRGVIHGAGVLDSHLLLNLEESHLEKVMAPKVVGVMNLHMVTQHLKLDYFVLQSSIASYIGMPGQGNYGAANIFLDVFARWRRQRGLAAQSINWGALEVGMAARKHFIDNFTKRGYNLLTVPEIRSCFFHALMQNATEVVYANLDWQTIARDFSPHQMARIATTVKTVLRQKNIQLKIKEAGNTDVVFDIDALREADDKTKQMAVERFIQFVAKKTTGADVSSLKLTTTFSELGMDSMSSVTFSNVVYQATSYRIPQATLLDHERTLQDVVVQLCVGVFGFSASKSKNGLHPQMNDQSIRTNGILQTRDQFAKGQSGTPHASNGHIEGLSVAHKRNTPPNQVQTVDDFSTKM